MYLKTPMKCGKPMKKIKEYQHFILFEDETGIKEAFQFWDLTHEIINQRVYSYDDKGNLVLKGRIDEKATITKNSIKNDNRLSEILKGGYFYEQ